MSKQRIELAVEPRQTGKRFSRALRVDRKVPAIIYGTTENKNLYIEEGFIKKYNVRAYENALYNLKSTDTKLNGIPVLIKEVIVHPLTRRPQHVDLYAIDLKKTVRVSIEIRLEGKAIGIADGGLLNVVNRQIEIECLPTEIPESLSADISNLGVGDALHVSDLNIPEGLKVHSPADMTIAVVNIQEEEVVEAPVVEAAAVPGAAPAAGAPAAPGAAPAAADAKAAAAPAKDKK